MGLQDRDYTNREKDKIKNLEKHNLSEKQRDALRKMEKQLNQKKQAKPRDLRLMALILIGSGLVIYGLLTHPERILPIEVENSAPIRSF